MRKGIYLLPNTITLCGMFAGFYAIVSALDGKFVHSAWAIFIAAVFDALDGWVARLTHSTTKFGIEMDSLSDVISFGVAPAALVYKWSLIPFGRVGWAVAFLFVACGALRLARFNVQMGSSEKKSFTGMPIPAAASICAAMTLFFTEMGWAHDRSYFVLAVTFLSSLLMVSTLRYHGLKEINIKERKPFWILVILVVILAVVVVQPEIALFALAMLYLGIGLIENAYLYLRKAKSPKPA
jgi:CDP-diacylglycerol--serine O-phosphatidyltransferase